MTCTNDPMRDADERREFADRMGERDERLIELREQRRATIVDRIARDFAAALRDDLPEALWLDMKHRNVAHIGTGACASHDFCDANMVMEPVFRRHVGHTPDGDNERDASFWNDAWALAHRRDLTDTLDSLIEEYRLWCEAQQLPHVSADEQDVETCTPQQRAWIARFIERWELRQTHDDDVASPRDPYTNPRRTRAGEPRSAS